MRKFEIRIFSQQFEGELFAVIKAENRGVADSIAYSMLNSDNTVIDVADIGLVEE